VIEPAQEFEGLQAFEQNIGLHDSVLSQAHKWDLPDIAMHKTPFNGPSQSCLTTFLKISA
jgi:hypothetical protein